MQLSPQVPSAEGKCDLDMSTFSHSSLQNKLNKFHKLNRDANLCVHPLFDMAQELLNGGKNKLNLALSAVF